MRRAKAAPVLQPALDLVPTEPGPAPKDDALYGIAQFEKALSDATTVFAQGIKESQDDKEWGEPVRCD